MEREQVKAAFRQYLSAKRAYNSACVSAQRLRGELDGLKGITYDGMPHGTGAGNPVAEAVERMQKCVDSVARAQDRYVSVIVRAEELLALADDTDGAAVIRLRWFEGVPFDFIPAEIHLDRRTMFRHYNAALDEIAEKTKNDTE